VMGEVPSWARPHLALDAAKEQFDRALALDPAHGEAGLRLGRVQYLRHDVSDARTRLTRVHDAAAEPFVRYMAALFLGRIAQDEKRYGDAARSYQEAATIYPHSQTAWIALSHVLHVSGAIVDAGRPIEMMIDTIRPKTDQDDPWWQYHFGPDWRLDALMRQMWKEALR
jgi:tetratricopeptide (TPR) repeat protein